MPHSHDPNPALPPELAESTSYLLSRAVRDATRRAQQTFGGEALRFAHYVALCWVRHLGRPTQRELAAALGGDPSDLVTVVAALEEAGLLRRERDSSDLRRNLLSLTQAGTRWLRTRHTQALAFEARLCEPLGDGGAALRRDLTALLHRGG